MADGNINISEVENYKDTTWKNYSTKNMISYNFKWLTTAIVAGMISTRLLFFYEVEIGMPIFLFTLGYTIFTVWDAINDPFMGYLSDRPNRLWKRWGRRFPWIIGASLPVYFCFLLIFLPPDPSINVWMTFAWFLIMISLYDTFASLRATNYNALFPDKFRSAEQRTKVSGISMVFQTIALFLAFIIPPMLITYGEPSSYVFAAIVIGLISLVFMVLNIPGIREDKDMIERATLLAREPKQSFLKTLKMALRHKNYRVWIIQNLLTGVFDTLLVASIPYFVNYILKLSADAELMLYIPFLIMGILTVPLWMKLGRKFGQLKIFIVGMFLVPISLIPLMFIDNLIQAFICLAIIGATVASHNIMQGPVVGTLYDEAAVLNKKRLEGSYTGINTFVAKFAAIIQVFTIAIVHTLTQFDPTPEAPQSPLALFGIRVQFALVPMICCFLGAIIFTKYWDLKSEKQIEIQKKLKELGM